MATKKRAPVAPVPDEHLLQFSGNRTIDLAKAFPLKIGDLKKLEKAGVLSLDDKGASKVDTSFTNISAILQVLCAKVDASITEADVDDLEPEAGAEAIAFFSAKSAEPAPKDPT